MITATDHRNAEVSPSCLTVGADEGGAEIVDRLSEEWRDLCDTAADDQPFYRPEWFRAHLRTFAPGATVVVVTARLQGRLCLVLPLLEERGTFGKFPLRKLRAPVNVHGGRFDAMRRAGAAGDAAILATWRYLKKLDSWDLLQLRDVPEGGTAGLLAAAAQAEGFPTIQLPEKPNPYIRVPADAGLLQQMPMNAKLRSQLRQARRKLSEQGSLKFYRVNRADPDALERFYQLEASGWKGEEGTAILRNGSRPFYDEVAQAAARHGYFSLYMLEFNDELVAAHFSFTHGERCYSPIVTYNENFKPYAPGHLIIGEILKDCAARGIRAFDITGQDQPWKMKWTSELRGVNHHYVFKGARGNLAYAIGHGAQHRVTRWIAGKRSIA